MSSSTASRRIAGIDRFQGKTVVITGASAGIGREMALALAHAGPKLVLAARNADALGALASECSLRGAETLVVATDVGSQDACRHLIAQAVAQFDGIDCLINNAGISMWARFDEMESLDPFETLMRINYFGSLYCTYYALPHLKASRGRIVGVSSLTGKTGVPTRSGYAASKHAMAGFFDSLRIELADLGVTVTMAYPDFVATQIRKRAFGPDGEALGDSPVREKEVMTAQECAWQILVAAANRKRELIMSRRGKVGQWLKLIAPGLIDRIARRAIERGR